MDKSIVELSEDFKRELDSLWSGGQFDGIARALRSKFAELKAKKLRVKLIFEVGVYSSDSKDRAPIVRFPIATVSTGMGFTNPGDFYGSKGKSQEEAQEAFKAIEENAVYTVGFGVMPPIAEKNLEICPECRGSGRRRT